MKLKQLHIAILIFIGIISYENGYAFAEPKRGSRLNIKTTTVKKPLALNKFSKPVATTLEYKPAKTVNLYFSNLLINRNLSKANKEALSKVTVINEKVKTETSVIAESGEKLFTSEGLTISNIFPNPADDAGYFEYSFGGGNFNNVKIDFFNVLGTSMNTTVVLDKFEHKIKVYLKDFENGIYFYQLIADGKTLATKKLLVRHYN